jgi:hypothetical protein
MESEDYRASVYGGGRESVYDTSSLEYRPASAHLQSYSRDRLAPQTNLVESRLQGDLRQQLGTYDDFDSQSPIARTREREREYTY